MHDRWDMVGLGPCSFEAAIMKQSDFVERVLLTKRPAKELWNLHAKPATEFSWLSPQELPVCVWAFLKKYSNLLQSLPKSPICKDLSKHFAAWRKDTRQEAAAWQRKHATHATWSLERFESTWASTPGIKKTSVLNFEQYLCRCTCCLIHGLLMLVWLLCTERGDSKDTSDMRVENMNIFKVSLNTDMFKEFKDVLRIWKDIKGMTRVKKERHSKPTQAHRGCIEALMRRPKALASSQAPLCSICGYEKARQCQTFVLTRSHPKIPKSQLPNHTKSLISLLLYYI